MVREKDLDHDLNFILYFLHYIIKKSKEWAGEANTKVCEEPEKKLFGPA